MSNVIELESQRKVEKDMNDKPMDSIHKEGLATLDLEMIKRGIVGGLSMLEKAMEADKLSSNGAAMALAIQKTLKNMSDLTRLLEHDMTELIKSQELQANGLYEGQLHLQVMMETLKKKNVITEEELQSAWKEMVAPMLEELQKSQS